MKLTDVIRRPLVTEKTTILREDGLTLVLQVATHANKIQIREAVEKTFNVRVKAVNTMVVKPKAKSRIASRKGGRIVGARPGWKKAIVTLQPGDRIDIFEQV